MGLVIEGGTGNGYAAAVTSDNKLAIEGPTDSREHHTNHADGLAFNLMFSATPTNGDNPFLYVKNTSDDDLVIEGFTLHEVGSEYFDFKLGDTGTPTGGTTITPANLNSGSGNIATGTFENAVAITALTGGTTIQRIYHLTSVGETLYNFEQDVILKPNGVLTVYAQTGGTALAGVLIFNYHNVN